MPDVLIPASSMHKIGCPANSQNGKETFSVNLFEVRRGFMNLILNNDRPRDHKFKKRSHYSFVYSRLKKQGNVVDLRVLDTRNSPLRIVSNAIGIGAPTIF